MVPLLGVGRSVLIVLLAGAEMLLPEPMSALAGLGFGASAPIGARLSEFPRYLGLPHIGRAWHLTDRDSRVSPTVCILIVSYGVDRMGGVSAGTLSSQTALPVLVRGRGRRVLSTPWIETSCLRRALAHSIRPTVTGIAWGREGVEQHWGFRVLGSLTVFHTVYNTNLDLSGVSIAFKSWAVPF